MALKFLGHAPSFQIWVFELDGKQFVARNYSTPSPLRIKFAGNYPDTYSGGGGLVKTSGFDIISSTSQPSSAGIGGVVEWVWLGKRYRNGYFFYLGDIGVDEESTLEFATPIPYDGPVGGPGAVPPATSVQTLPPAGSPSSMMQTLPPAGSPSSMVQTLPPAGSPSSMVQTPPTALPYNGMAPPPSSSPSSALYTGPSGGTTQPPATTPPVTRPTFTEVAHTPYAGPSGSGAVEKKPNLVPVVLGIAYLLLS